MTLPDLLFFAANHPALATTLAIAVLLGLVIALLHLAEAALGDPK